ncbi:MAG: AAA family ATPase, partial [Candidatus Pseudoruminococcus sp.]|nr:AAA family ATPase [Candidatus Pseudoruminococcus sp.]
MEDSFSYSREQFQTDYRNWLIKRYQSDEKNIINNDCKEECDADCNVFFESGSVKFYISEFGAPGDPGIEENANGIRWGSRFRLTSLFHQSNDEPQIGLPPIVTFYSYKGGMGRTTTLMGFALWLASKDKRVAIIDCDLEAPGYLNFFNLGNQRQFVDGNKNGFVEFMADYSFLKNGIELERYCVTPTPPDTASSYNTIYDNIFIVPGGNLNDGFITEKSVEDDESEFEATNKKRADRNRKEFIEGLSRLNLSNPTVLKRSYTVLIKKLQEIYNIDIVLIDSRTGFNDIYGSTAFDLADSIVAFFGFSKQTTPGLRQLLDSYFHAKKTGQSLSLTICNSILPSQELLSTNTEMQKKWNRFEGIFASQIKKISANKDFEAPTIYPIHRRVELEELGMSEDADANFLNMVVSDSFEDYSVLFASIFNELAEKYPILQTKRTPQPSDKRGTSHTDTSMSEPLESIQHMRPLQLTKIILRELKPKLQTVKNFAEHMDVQRREMFLYRDCMKEIFNPSKFIVRGYKGAGKTCIYQALGRSNDVAEFIRARAEISFDCDFINVIDFDGISNHPLKLLEDDGVFAGHRFYNINAFWQILMWNAIFSKEEYKSVLDQSAIKERLFTFRGSNGASILNSINEMIEGGASRVLAAIEDDLTRLDEYLTTNNLKLFIMYDGLDNVVKPKYWGKAVSPLINKWGGNVTAYKNIHPKIFLRTDLFDRIEGTNIERLKDNIIDIDWDIAEVFGYLFKLVLGNGNNPSREAMWTIIRLLKPGTADNYIKN